MSKCISAKGEYSEHAPGEEEEFVCGRCYVVDEEAMRAEIERLRADRPSVTANARAEAWDEGYKAGHHDGYEAVDDTYRYGPTLNPYRQDEPAVPSDPMANVLDDCRYCQGTGMATLNPDEEPGSHICVPSDHTATTEDAVEAAARVLYESGTGFKLTKGKPWEELTDSSRNSQRRLAQALADAGLLATARTRPTRDGGES